MVEAVSGLQTSVDNIRSNTLTYKGKQLNFEEVEGSNGQVFQACTNLTDEEIANGNNDVIVTFSLRQALGDVTISRVPIEEKEREEIAKGVNDQKSKLKEGESFEAKELNRAEGLLSGKSGDSGKKSSSGSKAKQAGETTTADEDPLNKSGEFASTSGSKSKNW